MHPLRPHGVVLHGWRTGDRTFTHFIQTGAAERWHIVLDGGLLMYLAIFVELCVSFEGKCPVSLPNDCQLTYSDQAAI